MRADPAPNPRVTDFLYKPVNVWLLARVLLLVILLSGITFALLAVLIPGSGTVTFLRADTSDPYNPIAICRVTNNSSGSIRIYGGPDAQFKFWSRSPASHESLISTRATLWIGTLDRMRLASLAPGKSREIRLRLPLDAFQKRQSIYGIYIESSNAARRITRSVIRHFWGMSAPEMESAEITNLPTHPKNWPVPLVAIAEDADPVAQNAVLSLHVRSPGISGGGSRSLKSPVGWGYTDTGTKCDYQEERLITILSTGFKIRIQRGLLNEAEEAEIFFPFGEVTQTEARGWKITGYFKDSPHAPKSPLHQ